MKIIFVCKIKSRLIIFFNRRGFHVVGLSSILGFQFHSSYIEYCMGRRGRVGGGGEGGGSLCFLGLLVCVASVYETFFN